MSYAESLEVFLKSWCTFQKEEVKYGTDVSYKSRKGIRLWMDYEFPFWKNIFLTLDAVKKGV